MPQSVRCVHWPTTPAENYDTTTTYSGHYLPSDNCVMKHVNQRTRAFEITKWYEIGIWAAYMAFRIM